MQSDGEIQMIKPAIEDFYNKVDELIKRNLQKKAYDINLIDELHANENAHTRILMKLLEFNRNNDYFIFQRFLKLINEKLDLKYKIQNLAIPKFKYQWANIDGYIYQDNKIAIIIENKIDWANDQEEQIQRYIESANKIGSISPDHIYVIYLTEDGRKEVSDYSFTPYAKEILDVKEDETGRFIKINYKEDMLPFFKDILSYLDFSKEVYLKSALIQYIDYLDGRFGLREREKEFLDSVLSDMLEFFSIEKSEINNQTVRERASLYFDLGAYLDDIKKDNVEKFKKYESHFCRLLDYIYPERIRPGKVKNNFFFYFDRNELNKCKMFPFNKIDIKWNSYPNIIIFSFSNEIEWLKLVFPFDDFNKNDIIELILSKTYSDRFSELEGWKKDQWNQYRKELPYEQYYQLIQNDPEQFFNSVILSNLTVK